MHASFGQLKARCAAHGF